MIQTYLQTANSFPWKITSSKFSSVETSGAGESAKSMNNEVKLDVSANNEFETQCCTKYILLYTKYAKCPLLFPFSDLVPHAR